MLLLFHSFSCQYTSTFLLSTLSSAWSFFTLFPSFASKINNGDNFCSEARAIKIGVTLQFCCPCDFRLLNVSPYGYVILQLSSFIKFPSSQELVPALRLSSLLD